MSLHLIAVAQHGTCMGYETIFLYVGVALGVSFVCSVLEAVLLSMTLSQINVLQNEGKRSGAIWAILKEDVERPLTVILTLNTIAHTVGAIGVGSEVQKMTEADFAVAIASGLLTLAVLLFSEILPKTIGATYWRQLAPASAYVLDALLRVMWIIVVPIMTIRRVLPEGESQPTVPRDELVALAEISGDEGSIDPDERRVIRNLLALRDTTVGEAMTPRVVMTAFSKTTTVSQVIVEHPVLHHSRIPVYDGDLDHLVGIVLRSAILRAHGEDRFDVEMKDLMSSIQICRIDDDLDSVLDRFLEARQHLLAVEGEFGGTAGIITLEDVFEEMLGVEIVDESDPVEDMRELAAQRHMGSESE